MSKIVFKNTGKLKKDFTKKLNYQRKIIESSRNPIGIKMPLSAKNNKNQTLFEMTYDVTDQVKINLKNLILTKKGEYLCSSDFGTNLIDLYNQTDIENIEEIAMEEIQQTVSTYMPFVNLSNFTSGIKEETFDNPEHVEIKIDYTIAGLDKKNNLIIKTN